MAINDITKAEAIALLSEQRASEVLQPEETPSVAMQVFPTMPMSSRTHMMPVLSTMPMAKWVNESATEDSGVKPTTKLAWEKKYLKAAEIACIVPIHENLIADSDIDIWEAITPHVRAKFAAVLDRAVFFGTDKPEEWDNHKGIFEDTKTASNTVAAGAGVDLGETINQAFAKVEDDGFDVNFVVATRAMRSRLRGLRNAVGDPIYLDSIRADRDTSTIYGTDLLYPPAGAWEDTKALAIVGDRNAGIIGIREDIQVKFLDQATVGGVSLAERDMVALRFKFRVGFATAYTVAGRKRGGEAFPFASITPGD